jgi:hypothetical protein
MEIHQVFVGEWMNGLMRRMNNAADGDCFVLPTQMHLHAYNLLKNDFFQGRDFKVTVEESKNA